MQLSKMGSYYTLIKGEMSVVWSKGAYSIGKQRGLRSACTSVQSDQFLPCLLEQNVDHS